MPKLCKNEAQTARFLSVRGAAERLGVSKPTVSRLIKTGKIPCIRIGAYPLIPIAWLEEREDFALSRTKGG
jgi:excisionase family DNA binding protein